MKKNFIEKIENRTGFVKAQGESIYDGEGNRIQFKGVNLGNWFVQEFWMAVSGVGKFDTGVYTQKRGMQAMKANPNLTDEQIENLNRLYLDTYVQESDFAIIAGLGLNCVRINFTYMNLCDDFNKLKEHAFEKLDWALSMCEKYHLYCVLDLHGAFGSQNKDHHSGDDSQFDLYGNHENMELTKNLWVEIASKYRDNKTVAAYDLLNETRRAVHQFTGKKQFDYYDVLYKAVRAVDNNHMIIMECFTFPIHGAKPTKYNWQNICYSYHIYNLTPFSQRLCLNFYKFLHKLMGYKTPVYIGEWNAFKKEKAWHDSLAFFDREGWSYTSWTYKTNKYLYLHKTTNWGIFELSYTPVDLSSATYEEIANMYARCRTENAKPSLVHKVYSEHDFQAKQPD